MSQKEFNTDYVNKYVKIVKHKLEFAFSHLARFVYNISTFGRHFECPFGTSFPACQDNLRLPKPPAGFPSRPSQVCLNIMALACVEWSWRGGGSRVEDILKEVTPLALGEFHIIWKDNIEGLNEKEVYFGYVCLLSIVCVSLSFGQPTMQAYFSIRSRRVQRNWWRGREHFFWTPYLVLWYYVVRFWQMTSYDNVTKRNVKSILTSSVIQQQQQHQQSLLCSLPSIFNIWMLGGLTALQHLPET